MADPEELEGDEAGGVDDGVIKLEDDLGQEEQVDGGEVQFMDDISCIIDEGDSSGSGIGKGVCRCSCSGAGSDVTVQKLLVRMKRLEEQVASQPLVYQVLNKCNRLEEHLNVMKNDVDNVSVRLREFDKAFGMLGRSQTNIVNGNPSASRKTSTKIQARSLRKGHFDKDPEEPEPNTDSDSDKSWQPDTDIIDMEHGSVDPESMNTDNEEEEATTRASTSPAIPAPIRKDQKPFKCKICKPSLLVSFSNSEGLANHYTSQHQPPSPSSVDGSKSMKSRVTRSSSSTLVIAKPEANVSTSYRKHISSDTAPGKPYSCTKCRSVFAGPKVLTNHMNSVHQLTINCEFCERKFETKKMTMAHQKQVHGKISEQLKCRSRTFPQPQDIPCPEDCGRAFSRPYDVRIHLPICRGLNPYKCDDCRKAFQSPRSLHEHIKFMHDPENRVVCSECGVSVCKRYIKKHLKTHAEGSGSSGASGGGGRERHYCQTCGAGFLSMRNLEEHQYRHTGERPFPCSHCDKRFDRRTTLQRHEFIHTGKPHVCDVCGWTFATSNLLKRHKMNHAKGKARTTPWARRKFVQPGDEGSASDKTGEEGAGKDS